MIDLLRLDERLIHGQVATGWVKQLRCDTLLVVDDSSANDKFLTNTLYMAAPAGIKTFVMTNEQALNVLNDPRCDNRHVFVVVKTMDTLLNLVTNARNVKEIQISNYGRMVPSNKTRKNYGGHLFLDEDEVAILKKVHATGLPCSMQMTPTSPKTDLSKILKDE